ncbi:MAG: hypothetical protein PHQ17_02450 [Methanobacterium sp.]|nr:hypothetical protein [Methanobacterium sp.]
MIDVEGCRSYTNKMDIESNMINKVQKSEDYILPGGMSLGSKSSYNYRR